MKIIERQGKKSEPLTKEEFAALKKFVATCHTVVDAAFIIGINRQTLDRVLLVGSGSPETIGLIKQALNHEKSAA